jgi:type VII secretion integral membrane protein EccD
LARLTIRAPRRRLDLAVPHQVPLAELLPEVLRRAGETDLDRAVVGGWMLRRGDGAALVGDAALAPQGVRDGDVLYLVPRNLTWPEPAYDDVVEEIAAGARAHGGSWDPRATRVFALAAAGALLVAGLALLALTDTGVVTDTGAVQQVGGLVGLAVALLLLLAGGLLTRAGGDGMAGSTAAGFGLPYAAVGAGLLIGGPARLLVGACALILAAAVGGVAVGYGRRVFVAGATVGLFGAVGGVLGLAVSPAGAAAIVVMVLVGGVGLAPLLAVRLGKLPLPVVTAEAEVLAAERRPDRPAVLEAVVRADDILVGLLLGIAVSGVATVAVLAASSGPAPHLLAGLASVALLLRARLFPALAARLPLLVGGLSGLGCSIWSAMAGAGTGTRLAGVGLAFVAVVVLLVAAAAAPRRRPGGSPYLGRMVDLVDIAAVVALAPVACGVLNLYGWVGGLVG